MTDVPLRTRPDLGPGGLRALLPVVAASVVGAAGIVLIAESIARQLAALASGTNPADWLLLGAIGVVLRAGGVWAQGVFARRSAIRVKAQLRGELVRRIGAGDPSGGGTAILATEGLDALDEYYTVALPAIITAVVVPLATGARILGADLVSAIILVLTVPLVPVFMSLIGLHTRDKVDRATDALTRLADHLVELARGLPVLVGLGRLEEQLKALDGIQKDYRTRTIATLRTAFLSALALEMIATISVAVVAVFLGIRLLDGSVSLEVALIALLLAPECFTALRDVGAAFHSSQDGLSALGRIKAMLADGRVATEVRPGPPALIDVTVRYPGRAAALADFSLRPVPGRITAITGPSGCGKSTALAALVGALPADAEVTGVVSGERQHTAYAAQTPRFAEETLADELVLAGADRVAAARLADELGLSAVLDMPLATLSPGEQRRAGLARAFARVDSGAWLLVLDEPTAHLDDVSADLVRAAILARSGTVSTVLVTHEAATLALADERVAVRADVASVSSDGAPQTSADAASDAPAATSAPARSDAASARPRPWAALRTVLGFAPWRWVGAAAMGALAFLLGMSLTAVSAWLIVRASDMEHIMYLLVAIVGVRFFGLGRPVARYVERLLSHDAVFRATDALRLRLWRRLAAQGPAMRGLLGGGAALDVLVTEPAELREQLPRVIPPLGAGIASLLAVGIVTQILAPELAPTVWIVLVATLLLAAGAAYLTARRASRERVAVRSLLVRRIAALGDAADELRAGGMVGRVVARIDALGERLAVTERRGTLADGLGSALTILGCAGLAVAVPMLAPQGLAVETVAVVSLLALALIEGVNGVIAATRRIPTLTAVLARLSPVLDTAETVGGTRQLDGPVQRLELQDVERRLPGVDEPLFAGVDATLEPGQRLRLAGPSGSGKSTLLAMIMGSLEPDAGAVLADGVPVAELDRAAWSRHVAWCPQEAHVFDSSIRGNLLIGRGRDEPVDDAELADVLTQAGLGPLLGTLPDGLATRVGSAGRALSGGERQRLAVARALLSRAEILLLDEPTAHLDEPTAQALMADVRAASDDRFVVLVSHRSTDHRDDDRVVTLASETAASVVRHEYGG